jgi:hypothetical protein
MRDRIPVPRHLQGFHTEEGKKWAESLNKWLYFGQ